MDPLHFLEPEELLRFFHCKKTSLSCMEKPHTFLSQLRDHNLIPEDGYQVRCCSGDAAQLLFPLTRPHVVIWLVLNEARAPVRAGNSW